MGSILVQILLGDSKINEVNLIDELVVFFVVSNHDIIGLQITMDEALIVEHLKQVQKLDAHGDCTLERKVLLVALQDVLDAHS